MNARLRRAACSLWVLGLGVAGTAQAATAVLDVTGIGSYTEFNGANTVLYADIAAGSQINYMSWDVDVTAYEPSWLSELSLFVTDLQVTSGLFFNISDEEVSGTRHYRGAVNLADLGSSFNVGEDGTVRFEFFEVFDDLEVGPDGLWNAGTLTFSTDPLTAAVPEPSTYALMALGLAAIGLGKRRRSGATQGAL